MNETTTAPVIERDDTVRLTGRRGHGTVTAVEPHRIEIIFMWRTGYRAWGTRLGWWPRERVELVRKGNDQDDQVNALFDEIDTPRAAAAGLTLAQYRADEERRQAEERTAWAAQNTEAGRLRAAALAARADADREAERLAAERVVAAAARAAEEEQLMAAAAAFNVRHTAAHGGDFLAGLLCTVGKDLTDENCPLLAGRVTA